jgi:hypothetical protein
MPPRVEQAEAALVVHAAARAQLAADITRQKGASATWIVAPNGAWNLVEDDLAIHQTSPITAQSPVAPVTAALSPQDATPDETPGI